MLHRRASFSHREHRSSRRLYLALGLATLLFGTRGAHAATVVILSPSAPSADVTQTLTLLRGELLSVGLEVTMSDRSSGREVGGADSVAWLETFAARGVSAVVDPSGDQVLEALDVWIVKSDPQRFEVTHVAADPSAPRQPEMLSLRALEALRAGLLQIDWAARRRREEAIENPPVVAAPAVQLAEPTTPRERVGLEVGAAAVMSLGGLGPAVLPTLRAAWVPRPWLMVQGSLAGFGSRSLVLTGEGSARVAEQYALVGGYYRLRAARRLWPVVGLAGGVLRTSIDGQTGPDTGGHSAERWSALLDATLGAGLRLGGRYYLTVAAHAQLAQPYVAIHIVDRVGATCGRPNLLLTLTVGAWL
jgi:hypothetical protein